MFFSIFPSHTNLPMRDEHIACPSYEHICPLFYNTHGDCGRKRCFSISSPFQPCVFSSNLPQLKRHHTKTTVAISVLQISECCLLTPSSICQSAFSSMPPQQTARGTAYFYQARRVCVQQYPFCRLQTQCPPSPPFWYFSKAIPHPLYGLYLLCKQR